MQCHIKPCCETFGAMVLTDTNLGPSGVESKEKKPTEKAALPGQGGQVPPGDSIHVALRPLKSFPTPALPVAPKEDKGHFSGSGDSGEKSPLDKVWLTSCAECCLSILKHSEVSGRERMGAQVGWRTSVLGQLMVRSVFFALEFKGSRCLSPSAFPFPQPCSGWPRFPVYSGAAGPRWFLGSHLRPCSLLPQLLSPGPHPSSVEPASSLLAPLMQNGDKVSAGTAAQPFTRAPAIHGFSLAFHLSDLQQAGPKAGRSQIVWVQPHGKTLWHHTRARPHVPLPAFGDKQQLMSGWRDTGALSGC